MDRTMIGRLICIFVCVIMMGSISPAGSVNADLIWPIPEPEIRTPVPTIDYLVLVNKENPLPEQWESEACFVHTVNSFGDDVEAEAAAYGSFLELKEALAAEDIFIDLDSGYRSVAVQQAIVEDFKKRYGEDYAKQYAAVPGYSEHHTGLALDLYFNIDGKDVYLNEDLVQYPEIWEKIHAKLADFGFILRYPEGKEDITGYGYEPWHIRYVKYPDIAREITEKGLTLEEYLEQEK